MKATLAIIAFLMATSVLAAPVKYRCQAAEEQNFFQMSELTMSLSSTRITIHDPGLDEDYVGLLDTNYHPSVHTGSVRFSGLDMTGESGEVFAIVSKKMLAGSARGTLTLQWRGETFEKALFTCELQ
jgi:hypothetical protein